MNIQILQRQRGIATVLIVLLVGVALSASTLGVIYSVKSTQSKQITSHASTNAQSAAWALAEAARVYLEKMGNEGKLTALDGKIAAALAAGTSGHELALALPATLSHLANSKIYINSTLDIDGKAAYELTINAVDTISKASTVLNVVYQVTPGASPVMCPGPGGNQFTGVIEGDRLDIRMSGDNNEIVVDGSYISTEDHALVGIRQFSATGDITLDGTAAAALEALKANGTITARVVNSISKIESGSDIIIPDGSNQDLPYLLAAGNISWGAHNSSEFMQAGARIKDQGFRQDKDGTITFTKGINFDTLISRGAVDLDNNAPSSIGDLYSLSDVTFSINESMVSKVVAAGDITCNSSPNITAAEYGGQISGCDGFTNGSSLDDEASILAKIENTKSPINGDEPLMATYIPVELKQSTIADANAYPANFAFHYDDTSGEIRVKVKNVNGISQPDGGEKEYILSHSPYPNALTPVGETPAESNFRLCTSTTNRCLDFIPNTTILEVNDDTHRPTKGGVRIAKVEYGNGTAPVNDRGVIPIDQPDGIWVITNDTKELPPGIFYFDRDLRLTPSNDARLANGFLSAGDVQTSQGVPMIYALNGLSAEIICANNAIIDTTGGQHNAEAKISANTGKRLFPEQNGSYAYPTNFCNTDGTKIRGEVSPDETDPNAAGSLPYIGQFVIMAGQENPPEDPDGTPTYQGGNYFAQTSGSFYGRIIAGNTFNSADRGNISVHGSIGSEARLAGKSEAVNTIVGTITVHTDYLETLEADDDKTKDCTPSQGQASSPTRLVWSRYL